METRRLANIFKVFNNLIIIHVQPLRVPAEVGAIWRGGKHAARALVVSGSRKSEVSAMTFLSGATLCGAVELASGRWFLQNVDVVPQSSGDKVNMSFSSINYAWKTYFFPDN